MQQHMGGVEDHPSAITHCLHDLCNVTTVQFTVLVGLLKIGDQVDVLCVHCLWYVGLIARLCFWFGVWE